MKQQSLESPTDLTLLLLLFFRPWEEPREHGENPHRQRGNMRTWHRRVPGLSLVLLVDSLPWFLHLHWLKIGQWNENWWWLMSPMRSTGSETGDNEIVHRVFSHLIKKQKPKQSSTSFRERGESERAKERKKREFLRAARESLSRGRRGRDEQMEMENRDDENWEKREELGRVREGKKEGDGGWKKCMKPVSSRINGKEKKGKKGKPSANKLPPPPRDY